jgi:hypothetical protein
VIEKLIELEPLNADAAGALLGLRFVAIQTNNEMWQTSVRQGAWAGVPTRWTVSVPLRPHGTAGPAVGGEFIADSPLPASEVRKRYGETRLLVNPAGVPSGKRVAYRCLVKGREVVFHLDDMQTTVVGFSVRRA